MSRVEKMINQHKTTSIRTANFLVLRSKRLVLIKLQSYFILLNINSLNQINEFFQNILFSLRKGHTSANC